MQIKFLFLKFIFLSVPLKLLMRMIEKNFPLSKLIIRRFGFLFFTSLCFSQEKELDQILEKVEKENVPKKR